MAKPRKSRSTELHDRETESCESDGPVSPSLRKHSWIPEFLLFASLAVFITWPLARHLTSHIPQGTERVATVPLFNLWTLWWNEESLGRFYQSYWDAPIFHPTAGAFALSEPQPLTGVVAALVRRFTGSRVFSYNFIVLVALTLNGWLSCRLLRIAGMRGVGALSGGAMVECLPFLQQEFGVVQLVSLWGVPLTLLGLIRLGERPNTRSGLILGFGFAATALTCGYYAVSVGVLVGIGGAWLIAAKLGQRAFWRAVAIVSLSIALPLTVFVVLPQLRIQKSLGLERSQETMNRFAAEWDDFRTTPWPQLVPTPGVAMASHPGARAFWPGTVKLFLAVLGTAWGIRHGPRRWTAFCVTMLLASFILSFGPGAGGPSLHRLLSAVVPGFGQLRSPFRFALFYQFSVALLAAGAISAAWRRLGRRSVWTGALIAALSGVAALESLAPELALARMPTENAQPAWLRWVKAQSQPDDVLAFLPFPEGRGSADYLETTQWMFWQTRHGRAMVNGYSGFFPKPFLELKEAMQEFPSATALEVLAARQVRYCVIQRDRYLGRSVGSAASGNLRLRHVFDDDLSKVDVYELVRTNSVRP